MFKGVIINDTTVVANTNIPLTVTRNTNANTQYNSTDGTISIKSAGYYDILATIVATSTAGGTITAQLFGDGVAIVGATSTQTVEANGTATFCIVDNEKISPTFEQGFEKLSIQFNAGVTVEDAIVLVEKRK